MNQEIINIYLQRFNSNVYLNKRDVMYRISSPVTIDQFWPVLLSYRKKNSTLLPLRDQQGKNFWFFLTDTLKDNLVLVDKQATQNIFEKASEKIQKSIILNALIDEAFNSSVIEGAFSTKKRTKEMIEKRTAPTNKSEQMIYNNYKALDFVLENLDKPINEETILSIYNIVINETLEEEDKVEKYRTDMVYVWELNANKPIYTPPSHLQVQTLMDKLIEFINSDDDLHPVIKSCVIHFIFVYIHPFFDGNGRTARAVSYMYLLKNGYNFFKFFSISSVVKEQKSKYYKALRDTEDYDSDLTYFIYFYVQMILASIVKIYEQFEKEYLRKIVQLYLESLSIKPSKRQAKALNFFIKTKKNIIDIEEYKNLFNVTYETARTDLKQLEKLGLFTKLQEGRKFIFKLANTAELLEKIEEFATINRLQ